MIRKIQEHLNKNKKAALWIRVLAITLLLYGIAVADLLLSQNVIIFPTVVMLGSFMIPLSYVAFFYQRRKRTKTTTLSIFLSFFFGGIVGVLMASIFEPLFITRLDFATAFMVGLIEEFAKIFALFILVAKRNHNVEYEGIILGAATGMGFASFESMGYGFAAFLSSSGSITTTVGTTLLRGILSPIGHGTWTAILAGILFRESAKGKFNVNLSVVLTYLLVSLLHGLWDGLPTLFSQFLFPGADFFLAESLVALAGFVVLAGLWRQAKSRLHSDKFKANPVLSS